MTVLRCAAALIVPLALTVALPAGATGTGTGASLALPSPAKAAAPYQFRLAGVARPEATVDVTTNADRALQYPQTRTCLGFTSWLVIQVDEPSGTIGPVQVRARRRPAGVPLQEACRASDAHDVSFEPSGCDVHGMVAGLVVLVGLAATGSDATLEFFEPATGKKLLGVRLDEDKPSLVTPIPGDSAELHFLSLLDAHCSQVSDATCWKSVLRDNKVPDSVRIPQPVCPQSKGASFQAFAPAQVADVRHPVVVFESGRAACEEQP